MIIECRIFYIIVRERTIILRLLHFLNKDVFLKKINNNNFYLLSYMKGHDEGLF